MRVILKNGESMLYRGIIEEWETSTDKMVTIYVVEDAEGLIYGCINVNEQLSLVTIGCEDEEALLDELTEADEL